MPVHDPLDPGGGPDVTRPAPSVPTVARWVAAGVGWAPDGCRVEPAGACRHGQPSWWAVLVDRRRAVADRPRRSDRARRWDGARMLPRPDRLDLADPGAP